MRTSCGNRPGAVGYPRTPRCHLAALVSGLRLIRRRPRLNRCPWTGMKPGPSSNQRMTPMVRWRRRRVELSRLHRWERRFEPRDSTGNDLRRPASKPQPEAAARDHVDRRPTLGNWRAWCPWAFQVRADDVDGETSLRPPPFAIPTAPARCSRHVPWACGAQVSPRLKPNRLDCRDHVPDPLRRGLARNFSCRGGVRRGVTVQST